MPNLPEYGTTPEVQAFHHSAPISLVIYNVQDEAQMNAILDAIRGVLADDALNWHGLRANPVPADQEDTERKEWRCAPGEHSWQRFPQISDGIVCAKCGADQEDTDA